MAKKKTDAPEAQEEILQDHAEPRVYELGFHIDPELGAEEAKKVYQNIRTKIASLGTVVAEGEPQKLQLAYTISRKDQAGRRDFDASFFAWIAYETVGEGHTAVTTAAHEDRNIFRFIDLQTTKEGAQHSAQMHEMLAQAAAKAEPTDEDEVSDVEIDAALKEVV